MKPKTLKDFELPFESGSFVHGVMRGLFDSLRLEAVKRIKDCCPDDNVGGIPPRKYPRCIACQRDVWFNNLIEEDLI